jgi:predicted DCC family thiol-disulfide oxidoreductase YuxK
MKESPIILFDGVCNFCNKTVNFLIRRDKKKILRFATLQGKTGQQILRANHLPSDYHETFLLVENGKIHDRSTAALKLVKYLPWYWQWTRAGWIFAKRFRDWMYNQFAKNRYKWFGKRDQCMVPSAEIKERFLE